MAPVSPEAPWTVLGKVTSIEGDYSSVKVMEGLCVCVCGGPDCWGKLLANATVKFISDLLWNHSKYQNYGSESLPSALNSSGCAFSSDLCTHCLFMTLSSPGLALIWDCSFLYKTSYFCPGIHWRVFVMHISKILRYYWSSPSMTFLPAFITA